MAEDQLTCLAALDLLTCPDGDMCVGFAPIIKATGMDRKTVRRNVRALARKGFAQYWRGLWNEHHDLPAGAGYCITPEGIKEHSNKRPENE